MYFIIYRLLPEGCLLLLHEPSCNLRIARNDANGPMRFSPKLQQHVGLSRGMYPAHVHATHVLKQFLDFHAL